MSDSKVGLLIWDSESAMLLHSIADVPGAVRLLSFSPDGRFVASSNVVGVTIVDVADGQIAASIRQSAVAQFRWSKDGTKLTTVTGLHHFDGGPEFIYTHMPSIYEWDWQNARRLKVLDTEYPQ
ncbi:MAG: hypothetical protein H8E66_30510 [Planctomycetes bacterium]|nr:hypothetical protein [Planctomycetota bacterium]